MERLLEGTDILLVVKSSLFRDFVKSAVKLKEMCRRRGVGLLSNPCDGPGADTGDTADPFTEEIADYALAVSRLQAEAIARKRPADEVLLVGHASRLETSNRLAPVLKEHGAELVFIDAWRETQSYEEWERMMLDADIAIECKSLGGQYVDYQSQKPAVKVLNYMSLGLPVLCDSLPAYRELGEDGKELLFADTLDTWRAQLLRLLTDDALRFRLGEAARKAAQPYSIEGITGRYMDFFERILARVRGPSSVARV
jgi:hypothetical protein